MYTAGLLVMDHIDELLHVIDNVVEVIDQSLMNVVVRL